MTDSDLYRLARPIPAKYIKPPPQGKHGDYVPHYVITQVLLATVGPFDWELVEIVRGDSSGNLKISGKKAPEKSLGEWMDKYDNVIRPVTTTNVVVGAVYRLRCTIDGRTVTVEETGNADNAYKEPDDGARLKKAASDAMKRCAMRLGVGLHMWCKTSDEYFLARFLRDQQSVDMDTGEVVAAGIEGDDE